MEELKLKIPDFNTPSVVAQNTAEANPVTPTAPNDKIVTLTVSGSGKTPDEAKTNALRSAIEQAFGTFISSKTEILNDAVVKDEIVSVANGNIQKYEVISELQLPDGGYTTSLKAMVSVSKLTSFVESKGVAVEFKGGLFAANILMQELYEKNEVIAIKNLLTTLEEISTKSFDYSISAGQAVSVENNKWSMPLTVDVKANKNFQNIPLLLEQTLAGLSLSPEEVNNYKKLNKPVFSIILATFDKNGVYNLRNEESVKNIYKFLYYLNPTISNFSIVNNLGVKPISQYPSKEWDFIVDKNFRMYFVTNNSECGQFLGIFKTDDYRDYVDHLEYKKSFSERTEYDGKNYYKLRGLSTNCYYGRKELPVSLSNHFPKPDDWFLKREFYVLSFANINLQNSLVQFNVKDILSLEEIKQLTKYEIQK